MFRVIGFGLLLPLASLHADEVANVVTDEVRWEKNMSIMTGAQIAGTLTGHNFIYVGEFAGAQQSFYKAGDTLYVEGRPSSGFWAVRDDQYCSQWPPDSHWACYVMKAMPGGLEFDGDLMVLWIDNKTQTKFFAYRQP